MGHDPKLDENHCPRVASILIRVSLRVPMERGIKFSNHIFFLLALSFLTVFISHKKMDLKAELEKPIHIRWNYKYSVVQSVSKN